MGEGSTNSELMLEDDDDAWDRQQGGADQGGVEELALFADADVPEVEQA